MPDETTPSQAAWNRFADRLKEVGDKVVGPLGARSARERADGFRYLVSLIAGGYELEMEVNRAHPVLARMFTPIRSFVGDGPDALYGSFTFLHLTGTHFPWDGTKTGNQFGDSQSDLYDGEVIAVNEELEDSPETVNEAPYEGGWMIKVKPSNAAQLEELMDAAKYSALVAELDD